MTTGLRIGRLGPDCPLRARPHHGMVYDALFRTIEGRKSVHYWPSNRVWSSTKLDTVASGSSAAERGT